MRFTLGYNNQGRSKTNFKQAQEWIDFLNERIQIQYHVYSDSSSTGLNFTLTNEWIDECVENLIQWGDQPQFDNGALFEYRLGDGIKSCAGRIPVVHSVIHPYTSLSEQYNRRACPESNPSFVKGGNLTIVQQLLQEKHGKPGFTALPPDDAIVIHLRLGDIIEKSPATAKEMLKHGARPHHHTGHIKSMQQLFKEIQSAKTHARVVLVGGSQYPEADKSRLYAGCLYQGLSLMQMSSHHKKNPKAEAAATTISKTPHNPVQLRIDKFTADQDFFYLCHSKQIILATGGYSLLIGRMVQFNGGTIVGETFKNRAFGTYLDVNGTLPQTARWV